MKIQFASQQEYQLSAIHAVVQLFEGQTYLNASTFSSSNQNIGNQLFLSEEEILANLQKVQSNQGLMVDEKLKCSYLSDKQTIVNKYNFTIEMETGTGKSYTFLRTIYELNKKYGFLKFVIVVPSVAIKEGTLKNLELTHQHFQELYDHVPFHFEVFDSKNSQRYLSILRQFAQSTQIEVLILGIDSFAKDSNIIHSLREFGNKPIELIQSTNPIVIVDEPQNMETDLRKIALQQLNPLFILRYSATHKNFYNLVYSLNPLQAYQLGLVKQIEVEGVTLNQQPSNTLFLQKILSSSQKLKAKILATSSKNQENIQQSVVLEVGDDLYEKTFQSEFINAGFVLQEIDAEKREILFANGLILKEGVQTNELLDEILKIQIERTIYHHFQKCKILKNKGIKVLSLFFIDKVAHYRFYDEEGNPQQGKYAIWFEEIFTNYTQKPEFQELFHSPTHVHNGYFSTDKLHKNKKITEIWTDTKGNTNKDDDTYSLIMRDKERLLSLDEPLQFIFSHSALREGWDNPNVFQICTLSESKSELKKRQEIGRGLRLPVNQKGERIQDKEINILTIIANESYEQFTKALQKEIQEETSVNFDGKIRNAKEKIELKLRPESLQNPLFQELLEALNINIAYTLSFNRQEMIELIVSDFKSVEILPTENLKILNTTHSINFSKNEKYNLFEIEGVNKETHSKELTVNQLVSVPNIFEYVQSKIDLTNETILEVLQKSNKINDLLKNPAFLLDKLISISKKVIENLSIQSIEYYFSKSNMLEPQVFYSFEKSCYSSEFLVLKNPQKSIFSKIFFNSENEKELLNTFDNQEDVLFFLKMPSLFKIPTPFGTYTPDYVWVENKGNQKEYHFVDVNKSLNTQKLFAQKCFKLLENKGLRFVYHF
jgi:type III restriction enzyme